MTQPPEHAPSGPPGQPSFDKPPSGQPAPGHPFPGQSTPAQPYPAQPHSGTPQPPYSGGPQNPYAGGPQDPYATPVGNVPYPSAPQAGYGGPYYPPGMPPPTDGMAIAALVCGLVVGPVGLILGIVALARIRRSGAKGRGLAITGIVLGAISLVSAAVLVVFVATGAFNTSPSNISEGRSIAADKLEPGHCANFADVDGAGERVPVVPCSDAHDIEIIADLGKDAQASWGDTTALGLECAEQVTAIAGRDAGHLTTYVLPIIPADPDDKLLTRYLCAASSDDATMTGSFVVGDAVLN